MKNTISNIGMNDDQLVALRQAAYNIGNVVGRREVREAHVYALQIEGELRFHTTFDNTIPGPWAFRICSTRWSQSQGQCVDRVNLFCEEALVGALMEDMSLGRDAGAKQYAEAHAINDKLEALDKAAVLRLDSKYGTTAYFKTRDDAEAWAETHATDTYAAWSAVYVAPEHDPLVHAIVGAIKDESGEAMDGLWKAFLGKGAAAAGIDFRGGTR